jgi:hypothetical protein
MTTRTFTGNHDQALAFLRNEGVELHTAGAILAEVELYGYEHTKQAGRSITARIVDGLYSVRSNPTGIPAIPSHAR